jgi:hypothetical protein
MQIGCFVYQYAKLQMLEFYYDFMDVFVDRSDFQYCSMDTDSAYYCLLTHFDFKCIFVKLVTFTEKRIYKVLMDISILTVYNVCMSLFVGDCFPVAGISI